MKLPLEIRFGRSPSYRFAEAVELAASLPGYYTVGEGRQVQHHVKFAVSLGDDITWPRVERLVQIIGGWLSSVIGVDGRPRSWHDLTWSVGRIRECHAD